jgi:tRNA(Leu) C34 or U34 (ribose-2'-O)-methylase TrmL
VPIRAVTFDADATCPDMGAVLACLADRYVLGLVTNSSIDPQLTDLSGVFAFRLVADSIGIHKPDRRLFTMAAAAARCRPAELVHVGDQPENDVAAAQSAGARGVWLNATDCSSPSTVVPDATIASLTDLPGVLDAFDSDRATGRTGIGVGPHPQPWPEDPRLDPRLLAGGDRRNVVDRYRYWRTEAVVADLDTRRHPFHVAIENWQHDLNIGTVVRNANAFLASSVRVIGRRRWNRRGAMVTDRYQRIEHHASIDELAAWAGRQDLRLVAIDNVPGAVPLDRVDLPRRCVLLFGQEGGGLSEAARGSAPLVCSIRQYGSTRSINAGVASGIAMHAWTIQHADLR